jgi:hypothetical protein
MATSTGKSGTGKAGAAKKTPVTAPTEVKVADFLASVPDERRRADGDRLCEIMTEITGEQPTMWGPSIVGFGSYHYKYESGHEGDGPVAGFSPRKANLVVYLTGDFVERYPALLEKLGPHKSSKACLYLKRLSDVDEAVLRELISRTARVARGIDRASSA